MTNKKKGKEVKRYNCLNFGMCSKADTKEVIEIDAIETLSGKPLCPHCHQDTLEEIPESHSNKKMLAAVVVVIIAIIIGIIFGLGGLKSCKGSSGVDTAGLVDTVDSVDTVAPPLPPDGGDVDTPVVDKPEPEGGDGEKPKPKPLPKGRYSGTVNFAYGTYSGELINGKPDGAGVLKYSTSHKVVETKDVNAERGDRIEGVFENGKPTVVTLFRKNGGTEIVKR